MFNETEAYMESEETLTSMYSSECQLERVHVQTACRGADKMNPNVIFMVTLV